MNLPISEVVKNYNISLLNIAESMVNNGYVYNVHEAFQKYLNKMKQEFFKRKYLTAEKCIELIKRSHGVPVLAHPSRMGLNFLDLEDRVKKLKNSGLEGLEIFHPDVDFDNQQFLKCLASKYNLVITGGSDFHGKNKADNDLGSGNFRSTSDILQDLKFRCG